MDGLRDFRVIWIAVSLSAPQAQSLAHAFEPPVRARGLLAISWIRRLFVIVGGSEHQDSTLYCLYSDHLCMTMDDRYLVF